MGMMGGPSANITEDQYVKVWEDYGRSTGTYTDPAEVRRWYRQYSKSMVGPK